MSTEDNRINPWEDIGEEQEEFPVDPNYVEEEEEQGVPPFKNPSEQRPQIGDDVEYEEEEEDEGRPVAPENSPIEGINYNYYIAKDLANKGLISSDLEITEDITEEQLYEFFERSNYGAIEQKVAGEYEKYLRSKGITEENINTLLAIENKVPIDEIKGIKQYESYAKLDPNQASTDDKISAIKVFLKERGWTDGEIRDRVDIIEVSPDKLDSDFEKSKNYFSEKVTKFNEEQKQIEQQRIQYQRQVEEYNRGVLEKALKEGVIYDETLDQRERDFLQSQIYNKNYPLQTPDGNTINVSPFEAFLYDFNNNLETQLYMFKIVSSRAQEMQLMQEKAEKKAEETFLSKLKKDVIVDKRRVEKEANNTNRKVYEIGR